MCLRATCRDHHARDTDDTDTVPQRLKRRGLIAGAAALVAGALARQSATTVAATNGQNLVIGGAGQSATTPTGLVGAIAGNITFVATNNYGGQGTDALTAGVGGYADGANNPGVIGRNNAGNGVGVQGEAPNGNGVFGHSSGGGNGVSGLSASGFGVVGQSTNNHSVYGISTGAYLAGVLGTTTSASGYGVWGYAANGGYAGVFSGMTSVSAAAGHTLIGYGNSPNAAGILGVGNGANTIGLYGSQASGMYAGYFAGKVVVGGDFAVTGSKSAAVPHPDGSHRLLYCVEAPEAWFEDFGEGTVANGKAMVALDPDFAALVETKQYYVFLTEQGDHNALFVTNRTATGFEVHAKGAPTAGGAFHYRVVAKRKDIAAPRLAKVDVADPAKALPVPPPPKIETKGVVPPKS